MPDDLIDFPCSDTFLRYFSYTGSIPHNWRNFVQPKPNDELVDLRKRVERLESQPCRAPSQAEHIRSMSAQEIRDEIRKLTQVTPSAAQLRTLELLRGELRHKKS